MEAYFVKNSSSTTAEMSRRGLPIPRRTRSYAIDEICESSEMCFEKERNRGRAANHKASVGLRGIYTKQHTWGFGGEMSLNITNPQAPFDFSFDLIYFLISHQPTMSHM